jgi:serine/threonine protein kinase
MPVMIGQRIKHYEIEQTLGKGGMGVVYLARDPRLNRHVALKVLSEEFTTDTHRRARFLQEARAACAVNHPAIAQVYEVDEDDGIIFIAMERVEGKTVRDLIVGRELDLLGAVEIGIQVAEGLARAHEAGIVHRDIKAENIMVTRDGHAKILDFGLAKLFDPLRQAESEGGGSATELDPALVETIAKTQDGMVLGTIAYMSPEQARGQGVDHRSDLFSFGVVLYEMVAGQLPFSGSSPLDTMHAIAFDETRPLTALRANLPPSLQRVTSRCLRKQPDDRYQDARQLVQELKNVEREIETRISANVPLVEQIRESLRSLKELTPAEWVVPAAVAVIVVLVLLLLFWRGEFSLFSLLFFGFVALFVFRAVKNRRHRLVKRFGVKVAKLEGVRVIVREGGRVSVIVDRAVAKTYVRVNALMDQVNSRMFYGEPFTVVVRDGLSPDEEKAVLQGPGVIFVRPDILESES